MRMLTEVEDRHWWYAERRHILRRLVAWLPSGKALDVGAAGGGNTRVLTSLGWDAVALEYTPEGAQVAASRGIPVLRGDATRLPVAGASLDLVIALDVLEHLEDDGAAAREIYRVLRPGGALVVTVPVDMRLWSAHDEAVGHVRRYTEAELVALLTGAGFQVVGRRSWMVLLRPLVALRRKASSGSDLDDPPWWLNRALGAAVSLDRLPGLGRLRGVSLVLWARRPVAHQDGNR
ncbi:class I SAM-dependent methyltransferase [Ornithinimicrobium sp. Y1847]|uniref:class I SAM-dependent methyltransferase n=1 Tax=unclassified Ornithinimicrobium TaxID=2615080 RepID=UPI003B67C22D